MAIMIGVFDSGFGGLTILSAFLKELPEYDYVYLGDSARAPYGNHSRENIQDFTQQGVEFLFKQGCKLVVLACNTASSNALRHLQEVLIRKPGEKGRNVLGVVVPIAEAIASSGVRKIAIIGTRATVFSGVYKDEIEKRVKGLEIFEAACPLLVPMIEEGWAKKPETKKILKTYLRPIKSRSPEVLVPACTHYPIVQREIQQIMGKKVKVLDTGKIVAVALKDYLRRHPEYKMGRGGSREFYTTDSAEKFKEMGSVFLGEKIKKVEVARI